MPDLTTQALNAKVRALQHLGRVEHFDSDGGGRIVRSIYCEPYTAHKRVATALRGTVYDKNAGEWGRAKPHADPLYPWFYCQDVQIEPAFPAASRASRDMRFNANGINLDKGEQNGQFDAIQAALDRLDDYDGAEFIDNLTPTEIAAGGIPDATQNEYREQGYSVNTQERFSLNEFQSRGVCGAKITATYLPLIFQPGIKDSEADPESAKDPFDYVDPQWEPITVNTQTGRSLYFYSPSGNIFDDDTQSQIHGGLDDTFPKPEIIWRFSIRRLMVPFMPQYTIGAFTNKINFGQMRIGNVTFPPKTLRMEAPDVLMRRAPDGNVYFDLQLKFLVRRLWDEYWDPVGVDANHGSYKKGWIGWNYAYGIPKLNGGEFVGRVSKVCRACYYPVCWNDGLFQFFGDNHPLFLHDTDVDLNIPGWNSGGLNRPLNDAPFKAGKKIDQ